MLLFKNGVFAVPRLDPFRCWAAVGGKQSGVDAVSMKLPASIVVDTLEADINAGACCDNGKDPDQLADVGDE